MSSERLDVWELAARGRDAATAAGEAQPSSADTESTVLVVGSAKAVSIPMLCGLFLSSCESFSRNIRNRHNSFSTVLCHSISLASVL